MRNFITLVESVWSYSFEELAMKHDTVEQFIKSTDGLDVLYRGQQDSDTPNNAFMTDYVGHAENYGDGMKNVYAYGYDSSDVLYFNDNRFNEMRDAFRKHAPEEFQAIYRAALAGNRFAKDIEYRRDFSMAWEILQSDIPYSEVCGDPEKNDTLVPLMQKYAREAHGKNIIAFHGNDYAEYGGQTEFVVGDVSRLTDLRKLYANVRRSAV